MKKRNLAEHFWDCITIKYFQFSGRASRTEFWGYILFSVLVGYLFQLADEAIVRILEYDYLLFGVENIGDLLFLIPTISAGVRRFHDTGRSGWVPIAFGGVSAITNITFIASLLGIIMPSSFILSSNGSTIWFGFISVVTACLGIYYLIIAVQAGSKGLNEYGPDPLNPHLGNEIDNIGLE